MYIMYIYVYLSWKYSIMNFFLTMWEKNCPENFDCVAEKVGRKSILFVPVQRRGEKKKFWWLLRIWSDPFLLKRDRGFGKDFFLFGFSQ